MNTTSKSNSRSETPEVSNGAATPDDQDAPRKRLGANSSVTVAPKVMTKSALLREAQTREQLRKEYLVLQETVKATEFLIPFVFYDGTNIPGGVCKVKKGDHIWLFLDRSRKVGAELGVGGGGEKSNTRREWARVSVDDLMLVRGEIIIPHVRSKSEIESTYTNPSSSIMSSTISLSIKPKGTTLSCSFPTQQSLLVVLVLGLASLRLPTTSTTSQRTIHSPDRRNLPIQ